MEFLQGCSFGTTKRDKRDQPLFPEEQGRADS